MISPVTSPVPQPLSWILALSRIEGRSGKSFWQPCSEVLPMISLKREADLGMHCLGVKEGWAGSAIVSYSRRWASL